MSGIVNTRDKWTLIGCIGQPSELGGGGGEGGWLFMQANFTKVNTFPITKLRLVFKLKTELNFRINN